MVFTSSNLGTLVKASSRWHNYILEDLDHIGMFGLVLDFKVYLYRLHRAEPCQNVGTESLYCSDPVQAAEPP